MDYEIYGEIRKAKILSAQDIISIPKNADIRYVQEHFGTGVAADIAGYLYPGYSESYDPKKNSGRGYIRCQYFFSFELQPQERPLKLVMMASPEKEVMVIAWPIEFKGMTLKAYYQKTEPNQ